MSVVGSLWPLVAAIRPSFNYIDTLAERHDAHAHHEYLDRILGTLRGRTVFFPFGPPSHRPTIMTTAAVFVGWCGSRA